VRIGGARRIPLDRILPLTNVGPADLVLEVHDEASSVFSSPIMFKNCESASH